MIQPQGNISRKLTALPTVSIIPTVVYSTPSSAAIDGMNTGSAALTLTGGTLACDVTGTGLADRLEALVITRGPQGSDIWANGYHHRIPVAPAARVVDPTGCGDAYRAGLLFARAQGWDWPLAGRLGALLGAIKIEHQGAQNHGFDWTTLQLRYATAFGEPWPVEAQPAAQT